MRVETLADGAGPATLPSATIPPATIPTAGALPETIPLAAGEGDPATLPLVAEAPPAVPAGSTAPPAPLLGRLVGGRYQVVDLLAQGGMSRLYGARDVRQAEALVAIKELQRPARRGETRGPAGTDDRWGLIAAFMREANILGDLRHPHIVRALDFIEEQGRYYIVMEWLGGHNLHHALAAAPGGLPEAQVLAWARPLCSALRYLHTHHPPIIFCDLKPSNVFLLSNQQIKLVDFGIAHYYFPEVVNETLQFGTPGFAAPEQYCAGCISPATDLFGLGRTLHCLLTGFDPVGQSAAAATFDYPPARSLRPEISARTSQALEAALEVDPAQRCQTVEALEAALGLEAEA